MTILWVGVGVVASIIFVVWLRCVGIAEKERQAEAMRVEYERVYVERDKWQRRAENIYRLKLESREKFKKLRAIARNKVVK